MQTTNMDLPCRHDVKRLPFADVSEHTYLIGPRYQHHCRHSGYEQFGALCAKSVPSPVRNRFLTRRLGSLPRIGDVGKWIDRKVSQITPRPLYTIGIFLIEAAAAFHMLTHRKSIYHILYGDTDYWLLGRVQRLTKKNKLVATFHEPDYALDWLKVDKIVSDLDAVILVSESQRAYFEKLVPPERIFVAPHGIDSNFFKPAERFCNELVGITVGTHHRDPGSLSRALDRIYKEFPNFRLKAVGARLEGGENPALKDERVEYYDGISDEDLRQMYQSAGVGIFSLNQATANNAILEAMACGIPVVATDIGGVREMVGDAGVLTRYWDSNSLADGVLQVLRDRELAARLGKAARERVLQFRYDRVADHMRQVYAQVLENGAAPRASE
jgi:glycosyltransferase involved in cell wall biosynthesis